VSRFEIKYPFIFVTQYARDNWRGKLDGVGWELFFKRFGSHSHQGAFEDLGHDNTGALIS